MIWTSGSIDKLEIYRRFGVSEVWFWENDTIMIFSLKRGRYVTTERSGFLPELDLALVGKLATIVPHSTAIKLLRDALAKRK